MRAQPTTLETPSFRLRAVSYGPDEHLPPHRHELDRLAVVRRGALEERTAKSELRSTALHGYWKPGPLMHSTTASQRGAEVLLIERRPTGDAPAIVSELSRPIAAPVATRACELLWSQLYLAEAADPSVLEDLGIDAWTALTDGGVTRRGPPPRWLEQVRVRLEDELDRPSSVAAIASDVGISPTHLARSFRGWFGMGPAEYRIEARLRRAAQWLRSSDRSISDVAFRVGFSDHAHLSRCFRRRFGDTPSDFRRRAAQLSREARTGFGPQPDRP